MRSLSNRLRREPMTTKLKSVMLCTIASGFVYSADMTLQLMGDDSQQFLAEYLSHDKHIQPLLYLMKAFIYTLSKLIKTSIEWVGDMAPAILTRIMYMMARIKIMAEHKEENKDESDYDEEEIEHEVANLMGEYNNSNSEIFKVVKPGDEDYDDEIDQVDESTRFEIHMNLDELKSFVKLSDEFNVFR